MDPTAAGFCPRANAQGTRSKARQSRKGEKSQHHSPIPATYHDKTLPIPCPAVYRDMYYPHLPTLRPFLQRNTFPTSDLTSLPIPRGELPVQAYNLHGVPIHYNTYVRDNPTKLFTRWLDWYLEIDDNLLRHICPADLNDLPCPWDELQGGCSMLRLCVSKRKYRHPHLGLYPPCFGERRNACLFIHDVEPTCWSLHDQLLKAPSRQFRSYQSCPVVARQTHERLQDISSYCKYGHDLEGARIEAWWNYWEHRVHAMRCGSRGVVTEDRFGQSVRLPLRPKRQTLEGTTKARNLDGSLTGRTWHGNWVTMTCMVASDKPVDDGWTGNEVMFTDWARCELRPFREVGRTPDSRDTVTEIESLDDNEDQSEGVICGPQEDASSPKRKCSNRLSRSPPRRRRTI